MLDDLLDRRPCFGYRWRGYNRAQVDGYVGWAEAELAAARRQYDDLLARYGAVAVELAAIRRRPPPSMSGPVSERLGEMLRLAAAEAEAIVAAGIEEAQRIVAEARQEAETRLTKVAEIRAAAADRARSIRDGARAEAAARLAAVQTEVDDLRRRRDEASAAMPGPRRPSGAQSGGTARW